MKFLADEGIDQQIVARLRQEGHEVLYVAEMDPGIDDSIILEQAARINALLITADKDFGELVYRQKRARGGVVLLRLAGLSADGKAQIVSRIVREHESELLHAFSVISPGHLRIRKES